jgi:hypothetical protein
MKIRLAAGGSNGMLSTSSHVSNGIRSSQSRGVRCGHVRNAGAQPATSTPGLAERPFHRLSVATNASKQLARRLSPGSVGCWALTPAATVAPSSCPSPLTRC